MRSGALAIAPDRGETAPRTTEPGRPPHARVALIAVAAALVAYAVQAAAWVVAGRTNGDEGWYLYDATLAMRGSLPYRDFAFTQTPLTLFVYGPWQLVHHSLIGGRVVSAILAIIGVGLCARVVERRAGPWAALAFLVIVVAFPIGLYNLVLVKTYALVLVLVAGCLTALTASRPANVRYPAATACAVALVLTRTSGVFVLIPIVLLGLWIGDRSTRRRVLVVSSVGALVGLVYVISDPDAAVYNLVGFHQELWFDTPLGDKVSTIVRIRLPDWLATYWPYAILGLAVVVLLAGTRRGRALCRDEPAWPVLLVGMIGFLLSQLTAGQYAPVEYFAPAAPILVAIGIVAIHVVLLPTRPRSPVVTGLAVVAVVVFAAIGLAMPNAVGADWASYVGGRDGPQSVAWLDSVADEVEAVTEPGDQVLALHLQAVLVPAQRVAPAGISMGVFSFTDMTTDDAERLGWVNRDILVDLLARQQPAAVVFDDVDWAVLERGGTLSLVPGDARPVREALERNYRQMPTSVTGAEVWVRR